MQQDNRGWFRKLFKIERGINIPQWAFDQITTNYSGILTFIGGSSLSYYLASITEWAKFAGPAGWLAFAVGVMLLFSAAYYVWVKASGARMMQQYVSSKMSATGVNILAPTHEYERMNLSEFFHPFFLPTKNVRFTDCELLGPASVVMRGAHMDSCNLLDCEIVLVRSDRPVKGVTLFENTFFLRCKIIRATLLMTHADYLKIPAELRAGIPVISDGRVGDV